MASARQSVPEAFVQAKPGLRSESAAASRLALALFRALDEEGVRYCHFKSNEHLAEGLAGITDLDVLLDRRHGRGAQAALLHAGFKRFASRMSFAYPGVEDYFGFDAGLGRLIHVHLHYALVVGEPHLKSYQLRMADDILSTCTRDAVTGVPVTDPDLEMVLLLLRCALKLRWREQILALFGRRYPQGPVLREFHWLLERTEPDRVCDRAERVMGKKAAVAMRRLLAAGPTIAGLRRLRSSAAAALADQRTHGAGAACLLRLAREGAWWFSAGNRRLFRLPVPARRSNPIGGFVVAFLGPDGSGKSTLARETRQWLGQKLDVYPIYFGSGKGPASPLRWPLKVAFGIYRRRPTGDSSNGVVGSKRVRKLRWIWALALALEKRSRMKSVARARNRGMVVICDRYPQVQVTGISDGPRLTAWLDGGSRWRRRLARWELEVYRDVCRNAPDLAIKLNVSLEVAMGRKPVESAAVIRPRRAALERINYGERCDHVVIEADRPLDQVVAEVKRTIWERL